MKALVVATTFPRWENDSGPAPFVFHLARHLQRHCQVIALAPHFPGAALAEELGGLPVRRFRFLPDSLESISDGQGLQNHLRRSFRAKLEAAALVIAEAAALRRLIRSERPDAVNAHWLVPSGLLAAWAKAAHPFRLVLTVHAADLFLLLRLPLGRTLIRWTVGRADAVFCVSAAIREGLEAVTGPSDKFHTLPMGADLERFTPGDRQAARQALGLEPGPWALFVGKLTEKKGVKVLLQALTQSPLQSLRLAIIGEGSLRAGLETAAADLGLAGRVRFLGAWPQAELALWYRAADLVAVPSVRDRTGETEGMPVVILEALASATPVIATEVCSVPPDLQAAGAVIVPAGDPEALARAIGQVLDHSGPPANPAAVRPYAWPEIAAAYARQLGASS